MKILVLVKEVPDTYGDRVLDPETGLADRGASERVLDEIGERAIEAAVVLKEADPDAEVVLLSMGPESAQTGLRKGLAMGADRAVHVLDDALRGADLTLTAQTLAAAIRAEGVAIATELGERMLAEGAPGLHFITMNRSPATLQVWQNLGIEAAR